MDTWNGVTPLWLSNRSEKATSRKLQMGRMAQEAEAGWKHPDMLT
jgi:hypothetical protein